MWRSGSGNPPNSLGNDGDFYLDINTGNVWKRIAGVYVFQLDVQGQNAYTLTTASFVQPSVNGLVNISVVSSAWVANGQYLFVSVAGNFQVTNLFDATHIQIKNLGYTGNAAPTTVIPAPQQVSPSGQKGLDGSFVPPTLNQISPSTTRGDLLPDNGANSPNASVVRLGVGSDGKALVADSSQPTGLNYAMVTPNAATDKSIPRFNGATGTPMPLQTSKVIVTDDGAIQASGSGGNARGSKAVDLQIDRAVATQVASGTNAGVLSGANNTASNSDAVVAGGIANVASGSGSGICAGNGNTASGLNAFSGGGGNNTSSANSSAVCAGNGNTASAINAFVGAGGGNSASSLGSSVVGGNTNTASGSYSHVPGGLSGRAYLWGQDAFASGGFSGIQGSAQASQLVFRNNTIDATPTDLFLDGSSVIATIPINTTWAGKIIIVGRSTSGVCAAWEIKFGIQNNANTVSLIAAATVSMIVDGTSGSWGVTGNAVIAADNTGKALKITMTGAAATSIGFVAHAHFVEVGF